LVPYREVYLHSNLTTFRTLKVGTGEQDCLARLPWRLDFGYLVDVEASRASDAISIPTAQLRNLTFSFRDWAGRLVPIDQPAVIELVFLDSDIRRTCKSEMGWGLRQTAERGAAARPVRL
jgi:hypothetical protein